MDDFERLIVLRTASQIAKALLACLVKLNINIDNLQLLIYLHVTRTNLLFLQLFLFYFLEQIRGQVNAQIVIGYQAILE